MMTASGDTLQIGPTRWWEDDELPVTVAIVAAVALCWACVGTFAWLAWGPLGIVAMLAVIGLGSLALMSGL